MSDHDTAWVGTAFFPVGGTVPCDAPSYVERLADRQLAHGLEKGEFCYVLTSRQMGKSSLMVRAADHLKNRGVAAVVIDLTAIGLNITPEQWYDGLILRVGRKLRLEDPIDDYWTANARLSPVQRFMSAIRDVVLPRVSGRVILFVDEIDVVRSLPFPTIEFFSAIKEAYNRRVEDPELKRLTFALFGAATPSDLIRDAHTTPFNIGTRIELTDFTESEAQPLARGLVPSGAPAPGDAASRLIERVLHWTHGHPYLTQKLCRAVAEAMTSQGKEFGPAPGLAGRPPEELVDRLCEGLFLGHGAREQDDNLLYVRERLLRADADLATLLGLYEQVYNAQEVKDNESDPLVGHLKMSGIVRVVQGRLAIRNRIYQRVFDSDWVRQHMPDAVLSRTNGDRISIRGTISIGRGPSNTMVLADDKVSRRHALIQSQGQNEFWLVDLGSSNGSFLNGRRVSQPMLLHDQDRLDIGPFRLIFHQPRGKPGAAAAAQREDRTIRDLRASSCWLLVAVVGSSTQIFTPTPGKDYPMVTGAWIAECKKIVDEGGGTIRKFLDDGFYACWLKRERVSIARTLMALKQLQQQAMPSFTMVLHHGLVYSSSDAPPTYELVDDRLVDFVFRMEDLAGFLGESRLMSESAHDQLKHEVETEATGHHALRNIEGEHLFFRF